MAFPWIPLAIGAGSAALGAGVSALSDPGSAEDDFFNFMNRYREQFFPQGFGLGEGTLEQARERSREIVGAGDVFEVRRLNQLRGMGRGRSADAAATASQSGAMTQRSLAKLGADLAAIMEQSEIANRGQFLSAGGGSFATVEGADAARAAAQQQFITGAIQSLVDPIAQFYLLKDLKKIFGAEDGGEAMVWN